MLVDMVAPEGVLSEMLAASTPRSAASVSTKLPIFSVGSKA